MGRIQYAWWVTTRESRDRTQQPSRTSKLTLRKRTTVKPKHLTKTREGEGRCYWSWRLQHPLWGSKNRIEQSALNDSHSHRKLRLEVKWLYIGKHQALQPQFAAESPWGSSKGEDGVLSCFQFSNLGVSQGVDAVDFKTEIAGLAHQ